MTPAHRVRRSESPAVTLLACLVLMLVGGTGGFVEGAKARRCPAVLEDGRRLVYLRLADNVCAYDQARPRPYDWYSPTELRRIASARERMEKVKEKPK